MNAKITLPELVSRLATTTSTTKRMSELFLRELFATITQSLIDGENVTIKDLGQFKRVGKTGIEFIPTKKLAETLNQPFEAFVPVEIDDEVTDEMLNAVEAGGVPADEPIIAEDDMAEELPVTPPPFNAALDIPVQADGLEVVASEKPQEKESVPVTLMTQEEAAETNSEPETDLELESDNKYYSLADVEEAKREASRRARWQGIGIGAASMLVLCALAWLLLRPSGSTSSAVAMPDTLSNADTVAQVKADEPAVPEPVVTDTTSTTMYLSRMAKKHYGRAEFWVYIYEENKAIISDPTNIPPGTEVVIPPASKYGIDASDDASVEKAKQKSYELFSNK